MGPRRGIQELCCFSSYWRMLDAFCIAEAQIAAWVVEAPRSYSHEEATEEVSEA